MKAWDFSERTLLMIPGPTELHPNVQRVLSGPIMPHYGHEWYRIYEETLGLVRKVFKTSSEVHILPNSGSLAIEMGIQSLVGDGEKVICVVNGFFGNRMAEISEHCRKKVVRVEAEDGKIVGLDELKVVLDESPDAVALCVVHNETSTCVLNPVREYVKVARERGLMTIVDAISSFGGVDIEFDAWKVDFCIGHPNKCLNSIPGAVPVALSGDALNAVEKRVVRSWYTNVSVWRRYAEMWRRIGHPYPVTMNTPAVVALNEALKVALEEGLENRYRRHISISRAFRQAVRAMGLDVLPNEDVSSPAVTAVKVPEGFAVDTAAVQDRMLKNYRIMVGGGLGRLRGKILRVAHMGVTASARYLLPTLAAIRLSFKDLGINLQDGSDAFLSSLL